MMVACDTKTSNQAVQRGALCASEGANSDTWCVRAAAWEFLALSFRYPDAVLAQAVASGAWAEAAAELAQALGFASEDKQLVGELGALSALVAKGGSEDEVLHALRVEATRLFVGAPEAVVSPFECVWRAADEGVEAYLFVNPHSQDVERFCGTCGLGRPEHTNDPLDHIAAECELLHYLASIAAGIAVPLSARREEDFPGGSPAAAYELFMCEHADVWVTRFAAQVSVEAHYPFYRAAAAFLGEFAHV